MKPIRLTQLESLPKLSFELPGDEMYIKLGCVGCANAVCFSAKHVTSFVPRSPDEIDLRGLVDEVEKQQKIIQGASSVWDEACEQPCPEIENIETVVAILNERFEANLTVEGKM